MPNIEVPVARIKIGASKKKRPVSEFVPEKVDPCGCETGQLFLCPTWRKHQVSCGSYTG